MTPGPHRPAREQRSAGTPVHARMALLGGYGDGGHLHRPGRSGVNESDQQGRRRTYRPKVDTPDTPPIASPPGPRFLTLDQVAEELQVTRSQVYALARDRSLVAVKIGGRGEWRVERSRLEGYLARMTANDVQRSSPCDARDSFSE